MANIFQDFPIDTPLERVFQAISAPEGLDCWWTQKSQWKPVEGAEFVLDFGPEYAWRAVVARCAPNMEFEFRMTQADEDWTGTLVGFQLERRDEKAWVRFHHTGWPSVNEHYRVSCHCWAMYLTILRRFRTRRTGALREAIRRMTPDRERFMQSLLAPQMRLDGFPQTIFDRGRERTALWQRARKTHCVAICFDPNGAVLTPGNVDLHRFPQFNHHPTANVVEQQLQQFFAGHGFNPPSKCGATAPRMRSRARCSRR